MNLEMDCPKNLDKFRQNLDMKNLDIKNLDKFSMCSKFF